MGLFYTRKKEETDENTVSAEDFIVRLTNMNNQVKNEQPLDKPKVETTK